MRLFWKPFTGAETNKFQSTESFQRSKLASLRILIVLGFGAMNAFRSVLLILPVLFCLVAIPGATQSHAPPRAALHPKFQPDVFLITIDTLRADHVHCYGYDKVQTPALDSLAKDGVRFAQAFTPSPITNTSHTTILTGLLPSSHGVKDFGVPLPAERTTWASLLKQRGYHTAAFIGAVILDSKKLAPGLDRGFDFYDNFPDPSKAIPEMNSSTSDAKINARWGRVERRGMDVVRHAEAWMNQHRAGPRFVWVHLYDPHDPYDPPPPFSAQYKDHLYDGEIAYADSALAHFLDYLKRQSLYDGALILALGDHGEGLGEHHEETHGIFLYDSTTHVPLIVKLPRGWRSTSQSREESQRVVNAQVRTTDLLPTILDFLRIPGPGHFDGSSLLSYFRGKEEVHGSLFAETDYPLRFGWAALQAVRTEDFKLIEAPRPEFYNLRADPGELKNIYEPWTPTVLAYRAQLADFRNKLPLPDGVSSGSLSPGAVAPETIDELHALGYLGPADAGSATNVPEPSLLPDPKDKIEEQNLLHAGMLASEDGRTASARAALERVLELDPKSATALLQLGQLELADGNPAKASIYLQRALEVRPGDSAAALALGQSREQSGNLVGAREALETSLKLAPGQFAARLHLGKVDLRLRDPRAAQDQFEAALLVQPENLEAQMGIGQTLVNLGKFPEAVSYLEPLSRTHADNAYILDLLGQACEKVGKKDLAEQIKRRAAKLRVQKTTMN